MIDSLLIIIQIGFLNRTFEPLSFHELLTRRVKHEERLSGGEGIATRKDVDVERAKKLEKRSCLVIGTNEVVRALEKGTLKLLLVRTFLLFTMFTTYRAKLLNADWLR